jgi:ferredoxin
MKQRVNLTFPKHSISNPLAYRLARDFNIAANIIRAQIAPNQEGKMVLELSGDIDQLESAIEWMRSQEIEVSSDKREIIIDENLCVDCGLCTGVCPTTALSLDPISLCIVCEQCISVCPVEAISINL